MMKLIHNLIDFFKTGSSQEDELVPQEKRELTPRAPRVQIDTLHRVKFRPHNPPIADEVSISNISTTGIAFYKKNLTTWPKTGSTLSGDIYFEGVSYPLELKIIRDSVSSVGAHYVDLDPRFKELLNRYFEAELAALNMAEINPKFLHITPEGTPRWIQGSHHSELYFVRDKAGLISHFNMNIFGTYIEGGHGQKTKSGLVHTQDRSSPEYNPLSDIQWENRISTETVELALKFLSNVPQLNSQERRELIGLVKNH